MKSVRLTRWKPDTQSGAAGKAPPGSGAGGGRCPVLPSLCSLLAEPSGHHEPPPASPSPASLRAPLGTGEITFLSRAADLAKMRRAPLVPSLHLRICGVLQSKPLCLGGSVPFPHSFIISMRFAGPFWPYFYRTLKIRSHQVSPLSPLLSLSLPHCKSLFISGIQWELKKASSKILLNRILSGGRVTGEGGNVLVWTEQWMSFFRISKSFPWK